MDADLDLLLIAVFCTADDLLPVKAKNSRRMLTDAEVVTLAVAQQLLRISSDEQFWAGVPDVWGTCSRICPSAPDTSSAASARATRSRR